MNLLTKYTMTIKHVTFHKFSDSTLKNIYRIIIIYTLMHFKKD